MKVYWGSGGIAVCILDLGTSRCVVSFTPRPLHPQGKVRDTHWIGGWVGGPQSQSGHGGEEKNSQLLPGLEPPILQKLQKKSSSFSASGFQSYDDHQMNCVHMVISTRVMCSFCKRL